MSYSHYENLHKSPFANQTQASVSDLSEKVRIEKILLSAAFYYLCIA